MSKGKSRPPLRGRRGDVGKRFSHLSVMLPAAQHALLPRPTLFVSVVVSVLGGASSFTVDRPCKKYTLAVVFCLVRTNVSAAPTLGLLRLSYYTLVVIHFILLLVRITNRVPHAISNQTVRRCKYAC